MIFQTDPEQNKIYAASPLDFQFFQDDMCVNHFCHPEQAAQRMKA
ncbi:MAG: hypothetical protein ACI37Q_00015 [Candidatus Gastranaerophilaceae bacterium]